MENKIYYNENIILIDNLNDFFSSITEIREQVKNDEGPDTGNQHFFFRGQSNANWEIIPSVYRGNLLASESDLIHSAYLHNPAEFRIYDSNFERLTKLQHYGLPTRLLDVTINPLVALYFACQPYNEIKEAEDGLRKITPTDGVVFYKRAYGKDFQDTEIETIALLSSHKIQGDLTLEKCLQFLIANRVYSSEMAESCRNNNYKSIIESLQNNYFVISTLNNERLIRQSGAFLLPGHYNISIQKNNIGDSVIQRGMRNLNNEFEDLHFIIPCEKKEEILADLDLYGINEGKLFPEFEHQMAYIKKKRLLVGTSQVGEFSRVQEENVDDVYLNVIFSPKNIDNEKLFSNVISKQNIPLSYMREILNILKSDLNLDWYKKESSISSIRLHLKKFLSTKPEFDRFSAEKKASDIINAVLQEIKEQEA